MLLFLHVTGATQETLTDKTTIRG